MHIQILSCVCTMQSLSHPPGHSKAALIGWHGASQGSSPLRPTYHTKIRKTYQNIVSSLSSAPPHTTATAPAALLRLGLSVARLAIQGRARHWWKRQPRSLCLHIRRAAAALPAGAAPGGGGLALRPAARLAAVRPPLLDSLHKLVVVAHLQSMQSSSWGVLRALASSMLGLAARRSLLTHPAHSALQSSQRARRRKAQLPSGSAHDCAAAASTAASSAAFPNKTPPQNCALPTSTALPALPSPPQPAPTPHDPHAPCPHAP